VAAEAIADAAPALADADATAVLPAADVHPPAPAAEADEEFEGEGGVPSTFEASDGLRLHYRAWMPAGKVKRVVVLVHGFADHIERYSFLIPHLVAGGAAVYGYDMRGNGHSPGKQGHTKSYAQLLDDLDRFVKLATEAVPGAERVIYAHSTGAILAMTYLFDHPDAADRVVLSAPCLKLTFEAPKWKQAVGRTLAGIAPGFRMQAGFPPESVSRDPAVVAANKADPLVSQAITPRFYTDTYLQAMPAALARIEDLKVPFLVIQGTADKLVSPTVADEFENRATVAGEIRRYEGGYHESHNDVHREEVFADLDEWLQKRTHVSGS
jgi:alpha-beta hydrolase superfamily lysophospholipase